jgi:hypothetical protein
MGFCKEKEKDILVWHYAASYFVQKATNRKKKKRLQKSSYNWELGLTQPYNTDF